MLVAGGLVASIVAVAASVIGLGGGVTMAALVALAVVVVTAASPALLDSLADAEASATTTRVRVTAAATPVMNLELVRVDMRV